MLMVTGVEHPILTEYFPGQQMTADSTEEAETRVRTGLRGRKEAGSVEEPVLGPGQEYPIYSSRDVLGCLPDRFEKVLSGGSRWLGVENNLVCGVLEKYERRLMRWMDQERRRSRAMEQEEESLSED
jgi:RNA polymerase I-specific transcription initiation factor RRN7